MTKRPIPLNLFGMPFGLVGLADAWLTAADAGRVPRGGVGDALLILSAAVWVLVTVAYLKHALRNRALVRDLTDQAAGPFAPKADQRDVRTGRPARGCPGTTGGSR
ncbi:hypothetical protein PV342_08925 [Streptomyces sp. PA03-3a]|nr:hypothetical protein [Streptomyces sp. PA03-3a]